MSDPVQVNRVTKSFGWGRRRHCVLDDVSFSIPQGQIVGLLGPNGAGKTTLIKIMLGMTRMDRGGVTIFGEGHVGRHTKERLGFLPEESYLYPFLTIRETLSFSQSLYKKKVDGGDVDAMLEMMGLSKVSHRKIADCSKGMRRRTALGQALIHDPELLLLDEPTSGYDPIGMREVKDIILDLKQKGKTILICSHQLSEVQDLCDGIVMLHHGHVVAEGDLIDLLGRREELILSLNEGDDGEAVKARLESSHADLKFQRRAANDLESFFIDKVRQWSASP